jgi:large subunit ribosomal protein L33
MRHGAGTISAGFARPFAFGRDSAGAGTPKGSTMAKAVTIKVKLVSSADTGFYYVTKKNSRTKTDKLVMKKYDPVAKKHVEFREAKIK